jgi:hypothetical protein
MHPIRTRPRPPSTNSHRPRQSGVLFAVLTSAALVLGACGGGDSDAERAERAIEDAIEDAGGGDVDIDLGGGDGDGDVRIETDEGVLEASEGGDLPALISDNVPVPDGWVSGGTSVITVDGQEVASATFTVAAGAKDAFAELRGAMSAAGYTETTISETESGGYSGLGGWDRDGFTVFVTIADDSSVPGSALVSLTASEAVS